MPDVSIDPGSLEGNALARWYLRSPSEIEQERQAAAARRYQDFFYGPSGAGPDPGFSGGAPTFERDLEPDSAARLPSTSQDVDPRVSGSASGLAAQPINPSIGNLSGPPPAAYFGAPQPAANAFGRRGRVNAIAYSPVALARASPSNASPHPVMASVPTADQMIAYGALRAPAPSDRELAELRTQQAAFADATRKVDLQNSWLAIPALAPVAAAFGLEGAAAIAGRALGAEAIEAPLNFVDREAWQRGAQKAAQALSDAERNALRAAARTKFARANGVPASEMQAEVHHSDPLEWAHLKPNADPNRLANLWGLRREAHAIATREWGDCTRSLEGRLPSQAELMDAKLRIDRLVEPYIRRAGLPRSNRLPGKGGPL